MSRMVSTTRFSKMKDTNTALFDQNGRRITGGRATLAPGETVVKRGNVAPPQRAPSTTRVSSSTRFTATVRRPTAQRGAPAIEEYDQREDENYEDARAERIRNQAAENAARDERKKKETYDFHNKYYVLCQDKDELEAYPGYRFGLHPPDPEDIHALGNYKMNLAECEKQEAKQKKIAEAKAAAQEARGTVVRSGRPPARTPKTTTARGGRTPGRRADEVLMEEIEERHRERLERQTTDFHYKYWPLCKDKVMLEAYPGFRFGMPVPEYDDLLAVNGYLLELKQFEDAEELAKSAPEEGQPPPKPTAQRQTKAQKAKADMDARVAAKRVSLRPPARKPGGTTSQASRMLPPGVEDPRRPNSGERPRPPSARVAKPADPEPPEEPRVPRLPRGPPPGYVEPKRKRGPPKARPKAAPSGDIEVEKETKVVVHENMQTRIYNLKQKAYEKGIYRQPPAPTPAMRARLTPEDEPACNCGDEGPQERGHPQPGFPQRAGGGGPYAKELTPVEVVTEGGAGRSILVPTDVATADHNTVVRVRRGTNIATPVDEEGLDDTLPPYAPVVPPPAAGKIDRYDMNLDAFDRMKLAEEMAEEYWEADRLRKDLLKKKEAVAKLRQAAKLLNQQKRDMLDRIELMGNPLVSFDTSTTE